MGGLRLIKSVDCCKVKLMQNVGQNAEQVAIGVAASVQLALTCTVCHGETYKFA